jgi:hypothetical protein
MSQEDTCLLSWWCPAFRWREPGPGFGTEQENSSLRKCCPGCAGDERESLSGEEPSRVEYRSRSRRADRLVVAVKPL